MRALPKLDSIRWLRSSPRQYAFRNRKRLSLTLGDYQRSSPPVQDCEHSRHPSEIGTGCCCPARSRRQELLKAFIEITEETKKCQQRSMVSARIERSGDHSDNRSRRLECRWAIDRHSLANRHIDMQFNGGRLHAEPLIDGRQPIGDIGPLPERKFGPKRR